MVVKAALSRYRLPNDIGCLGRSRCVAGPRGALVAVVLAVALAGCNDDPEPNIPDPTTSAQSTSTSPTTSTPTPTGPTEPAVPEAATHHSDAGAEAFVRYWVELINYGQATGDADTLESVMDSRCAGCHGILSAIRDPYASGGHIEGGTWIVGNLRELPLDHGADWAAFAKSRTEPQIVFDGSGAATKYPGGKFYLYAYVAWAGSRWSMRWVRTPTPKP
jgi:mono/diheme cytochrome c family protein